VKTLWPKYLLFKHKIEPINIEQIKFNVFENVIGEPITPPVLQKKKIMNIFVLMVIVD